MTDTSCSTDRLPKNTPPFNRSGTLLTRRAAAEHDDLPLEIDPEPLLHDVMRDAHEIQHVRGRCMVEVDDEIRVLRRDLSAPGPAPLQACRLDEPAGLIAGGILEDAAEAANPVWLRRFSFRLYRVGAAGNLAGVVRVYAKSRAHNCVGAEVVLETRVAVAEVARIRGEGDRRPARVQRRAIDQH